LFFAATMKITVLEESKNRVVFSLAGESHTLCNSLKEILSKDKKVSVATYFVAHPDIDEPTFIVETNGTATPKKVILEAVEKLKGENDSFLKEFLKEIK
jgi:DNA-directed RNA polymerase subunit L